MFEMAVILIVTVFSKKKKAKKEIANARRLANETNRYDEKEFSSRYVKFL